MIGGFFTFLFVLVWLYWGKPVDNQNNFIVQIINIAVGALTAAFATVVNFWLGHPPGRERKMTQTSLCNRRRLIAPTRI